jgi:hypothetical protein
MDKYKWRFVMGTKTEPTWEVRRRSGELIAYAKRAKDDGWFTRISGLNDNPSTERLYIGDDVFPPDFMKMMLEMHKNKDSQPWKL